MTSSKHENCQVVINTARTNTHGLPALCCKHHRDKHNQLCWIKWLNKKELNYLTYMLHIEHVYDTTYDSYGNFNAYFE